MTSVRSSAAILCGITFACTSEVAPTKSVDGNVAAIASIEVVEAAENYDQIGITLTNQGDTTCAALQSDAAQNVAHANTSSLTISIGEYPFPEGKDPFSAGSFTVSAEGGTTANSARAFVRSLDPQCKSSLDGGIGGSVIISQIDTSSIAGTFDISFESGAHLAGSFNAPICNSTAPTPTIFPGIGGETPDCK